MRPFEDFVLSRDFVPVQAFGDEVFSLMWQADMEDKNVRNMIQNRWLKVDEARTRNFGWDHWNSHAPKFRLEKPTVVGKGRWVLGLRHEIDGDSKESPQPGDH